MHVSGFRVQGAWFRVHGSEFRVQSSGFRVPRSGWRRGDLVEGEEVEELGEEAAFAARRQRCEPRAHLIARFGSN